MSSRSSFSAPLSASYAGDVYEKSSNVKPPLNLCCRRSMQSLHSIARFLCYSQAKACVASFLTRCPQHHAQPLGLKLELGQHISQALDCELDNPLKIAHLVADWKQRRALWQQLLLAHVLEENQPIVAADQKTASPVEAQGYQLFGGCLRDW